MRCTAGTDTKRRTKILFLTGEIVIHSINERNTRFALIQAGSLVAAWGNRHEQDINGKYETDDIHGANIYDKCVQ